MILDSRKGAKRRPNGAAAPSPGLVTEGNDTLGGMTHQMAP